jgi:hypothetical protein
VPKWFFRSLLELSCEDILERRILQREVCIQPFEAAILVFQFLPPLHIEGLEPAVLGLPVVVGRGTDAVTPPNFTNGVPAPVRYKPEKLPGYRL